MMIKIQKKEKTQEERKHFEKCKNKDNIEALGFARALRKTM